MTVNNQFVLREIGDDFLFIPLGNADSNEAILIANKVGAAIWQYYTEKTDFEYVLGKLTERFDCDEETLRTDLTEYTKILLDKKLLLTD